MLSKELCHSCVVKRTMSSVVHVHTVFIVLRDPLHGFRFTPSLLSVAEQRLEAKVVCAVKSFAEVK